jgi:hypothetical protein
MMNELSRLDFLIGSWKGRSIDQFGEKGTLDSTLECSREPSEQFLQLRGESRKDSKLLNRSVEFITYDSRAKKYVSKRMWSMGFIENGIGAWKGDTLVFQIKFDNEPRYFAGTLWRSFIRRYNENEIGHGLYTARKGGRYRLYGETKEIRVSK